MTASPEIAKTIDPSLSPEFIPDRERPLNEFARYLTLNHPDEIINFVGQLTMYLDDPETGHIAREVFESSRRYLLSSFGIDISRPELELVQSLLHLRFESHELPSPDDIPVLDLSSCWDEIDIDGGVVDVKTSTDSIFRASGNHDAQMFHTHFHTFMTGSERTNMQILTGAYMVGEEQFVREFREDRGSTGTNVGTLIHQALDDPTQIPQTREDRIQLGKELQLDTLLTRNQTLNLICHGLSGHTGAFYETARNEIMAAQASNSMGQFTSILIDGLGSNGTIASPQLRQLYGIDQDSMSIRRYAHQIYETFLLTGCAGRRVTSKQIIGHSAGAAAAGLAKVFITQADKNISESRAISTRNDENVPGNVQWHAPNTSRESSYLQAFPGTSFILVNPVVPEGAAIAGAYPQNADFYTKVRAALERKLVDIASFAGQMGAQNVPGVRRLVREITTVLMGLQGDENGSSAIEAHANNLLEDRAIPLQTNGIYKFEGQTVEELLITYERNLTPVIIILSTDDLITPIEMQRSAIAAEQEYLKAHDYTFVVPPIVLEMKAGHGVPYSEFMTYGHELREVLTGLNVEQRNLVQTNIETVQEILNGTVSSGLMLELAEKAKGARSETVSSLYTPSKRNPFPPHENLYRTLINTSPERFKKHPSLRVKYLADYVAFLSREIKTPAPPEPELSERALGEPLF